MNSTIMDSGMELLAKTGQALLLARDLSSATCIISSVARKITEADGATFILREGNYSFYADEDAMSPLWKGSRFPIDTCLGGWSMTHGKVAIIEDVYADDRVSPDIYHPTFVKSIAIVPIGTDHATGALGVYWAEHRVISHEEIALLQSLADLAASALETIKVYTDLEQRAKDAAAQHELVSKELALITKEFESFSYSISHDLRAPLRAIIGFSKMLEEDYSKTLDMEGQRVLGVIQRNAGKMDTLINDLLKFSRLARKELQRNTIDTYKLLQSTINEINQSTVHKSTIQIGTLFPSYADYSLLSQVWANLISNAIKFSSRKERPFIEIGSYRKDNEIIYFIKDNGAGFNMAYADKLFGVFQRLHKPTEFEGTGVGLAIVHRIVTKHGGTVWADAVLSEGATFYFSLPDHENQVVNNP
ncbi:sensor histidine kinase [Ohtaekwangia koreensis]|uniref:histidine kinase n=1 Tax=Ohtaekwangia koreensis TaxID=688867 RepID=A0A1T5JU77_9BACT|nr:ATP-binding protein [Ohtaekwangia koreensis]SKC54921.1 GAF domain-containing protein [Ohtaekwangia koreensis]